LIRVHLLVQAKMHILVKHLKVLDPVVERIPVLVMNMLMALQLSPKLLLHEPPMLSHLLPASPHQSRARVRTKVTSRLSLSHGSQW